MTPSSAKDETVVHVDGHRLFTYNADGTIRRLFGTEMTEPSPNRVRNGVKSKDVMVDPTTGVFVRIYMPTAVSGSKLPLLFYVHGGAFCVASAASAVYHAYLNNLVKHANVVAVSVDYRRAPEHRLPAAFDDCFAALRWLLAGDGRVDPWIASAADFRRVFLAGDSSGATVVHELGIRGGTVEWPADVSFGGGISFEPFFNPSQELKIGTSEESAEMATKRHEFMATVCLPQGEDEEYPPFNPVGPRSPPLSGSVLKRILVVVAEKDVLCEIGVSYFRQLVKAGVEGELEFSEGQIHVYQILDLFSPASAALMQRVSGFIHAVAADS